ncbi:MAG: hypothetical protein QM802_13655 [Agriterribacter sp.]
MKTRRNIYIIVGTILIVLNLFINIVRPDSSLHESGEAFNVGYFIGSYLFVIVGLILLRLAYNVQLKIKLQERKKLEDALEEIGKAD